MGAAEAQNVIGQRREKKVWRMAESRNDIIKLSLEKCLSPPEGHTHTTHTHEYFVCHCFITVYCVQAYDAPQTLETLDANVNDGNERLWKQWKKNPQTAERETNKMKKIKLLICHSESWRGTYVLKRFVVCILCIAELRDCGALVRMITTDWHSHSLSFYLDRENEEAAAGREKERGNLFHSNIIMIQKRNKLALTCSSEH